MNASSSTTARGPRLALASLPGQHTLALLWANRQGRLGLVLIGLHLLLAVAGRWLAPHDISAGDSLASLLPPSAEHWLGTDQLGGWLDGGSERPRGRVGRGGRFRQ